MTSLVAFAYKHIHSWVSKYLKPLRIYRPCERCERTLSLCQNPSFFPTVIRQTAMERNSETPPSPPKQDFVDQKWEKNGLLNTQVTNRSNGHGIRHFVESDRVKSMVMFYGHEKPSTDNNRLNKTATNSTKIVNFPHLARLANLFDPSNGVVIASSNCREIRSNKRVAEETPNIEKNNKKMKMKIDEENINIVPPDEYSRVNVGEFDDYRRASEAASNEDSDSGCPSDQDVHEEMDSDERTVDNKRSRTTHHDRQRKRKDKMKKKMLALQELLPGCNNVVDKASVLDEAIEYVKTLQHQIQVMSIGHLFMPTPMMIPSVTSQLIMPTLNQFSPQLANTGICLGTGSGFGLGPVPVSPQVPGFGPMSCVATPYGPVQGEGAGTNLHGRWGTRTTSFEHHQLGSSSAPPLSSYNGSSNHHEDLSQNMGLVPKPKDK